MMRFLRRLFCKHEFEFVRNIHGDEIIGCDFMRSIGRCNRCGKIRYFKLLNLGAREECESSANRT